MLNSEVGFYHTLSAGKFELVRLGNIKQNNSDEYLACDILTIPQVEYTGTGIEDSYDVVRIKANATMALKKVRKIDLYNDNNCKVTIIGANNFTNLITLEYFLLTTKIISLGTGCLVNCPNLKTVVNDNIIYLDNDTTVAHSYLVAIGVVNRDATTLKLHTNTRIILDGAFKNMSQLEAVVFNINLRQIAVNAFRDCVKLQTINLNATPNLKMIGQHTFKNTLITKEFIQANVNTNCQVDDEVC